MDMPSFFKSPKSQESKHIDGGSKSPIVPACDSFARFNKPLGYWRAKQLHANYVDFEPSS